MDKMIKHAAATHRGSAIFAPGVSFSAMKSWVWIALLLTSGAVGAQQPKKLSATDLTALAKSGGAGLEPAIRGSFDAK
jgi:hypothetical protein